MVKRFIYPPVWLLLGLIAIFTLNESYPGYRFTSLAGQLGGGVLILVGLLLLVSANGLFVRAGTDVIPFRNVSALVTSGVYRYTRNPMYLAVLGSLGAAALLFRSPAILLYAALCGLCFHLFVVGYEEPALRAQFGSSFERYAQAVPRWGIARRPYPPTG